MRLIAAIAIVFLQPFSAAAQPSAASPPAVPPERAPAIPSDRNPAVQWLLLQRAYLDLREHERELDAAAAAPEGAAERVNAAAERARLEYGALLASLVPVVPRLVVTSAVRQQSGGEGSRVRLQLLSLPVEWPDAVRRVALQGLEADLNSLGTIRNALVTIKNSAGTVIGLPFQARLESVRPGEHASAEFRLQETAGTIVVALSYAGRTEEYSLRLAADGPPLRIDSAQASQEADLGQTALYELRIERTTPRIRILKLQAVGLPPAFRHEFVLDSAPNAIRLSQYRFHDEELVRPMLLRVELPEAFGDRGGIVPDSPVRFRARVVGVSTQSDGPEPPAADVDLELIPRGVGRLTVQSPNFLIEGTEGSPLVGRVEFRNVGTRDVQDIKPTLEVPTGWTATVSPSAIPLLRPNEARSVELTMHAGSAGAGDYTVKIRSGIAASPRDSATSADLRVRVARRSSIGGMVGFFGGVVGLLAAVTYFGARLARW